MPDGNTLLDQDVCLDVKSLPGEVSNPTELMTKVALFAAVLKMGGAGDMNQTLRSEARSLEAAVASGKVDSEGLSTAVMRIAATCARLGDSDQTPTVITEPVS
jgi:hypothetical protein